MRREAPGAYGSVHWLRCGNTYCGKWRACLRSQHGPSVMARLRQSNQPGQFFCWMNSWDEARSSCQAPQEGVSLYSFAQRANEPAGLFSADEGSSGGNGADTGGGQADVSAGHTDGSSGSGGGSNGNSGDHDNSSSGGGQDYDPSDNGLQTVVTVAGISSRGRIVRSRWNTQAMSAGSKSIKNGSKT